jgi:chromodomain-helicase-DNA-binding protein 1
MNPQSSPVPPEDDVDEAANRRNPRRGNTAKPSYEEDVADIIEDDDEYDSQDAESEDDPMDVDDDEGKKRSARGTRAKQGKDKHVGDSNTTTSRRSARTTKYQASMKEPTGDSLRDLFIAASPEKRRGRRQNAKSPAARHKAVRRIVKAEVQVSEAEEEDFSDEEEEIEEESGTDEEEEFKIQRIVAARSERRRVWREVCSKINTSEIENGSRWFPDDDEEEQKDSTVSDETFEERFLIKWDGLSFLHCSWETQKDLVDQIDNAKAYFSTFFRKSENGLLFTADERCDGDYFDPAYVQIDRILEVQLPEQYGESTTGIYKFGIIMDKSHKDYDSGTGRQFLVKWGNSPYTDSTYEFERDLILNDIDYEDQVEEFYRRSKKVGDCNTQLSLLSNSQYLNSCRSFQRQSSGKYLMKEPGKFESSTSSWVKISSL